MTVTLLFLGVVFLLRIKSNDAVSINEQQNVTDMQTSYPSYQSSLTYADYAGLTQFTLPTPLPPLN